MNLSLAALRAIDTERSARDTISQPMSLSPGTRLGPYEITGPLGVGGMGEVYRARDARLNRDVAVKTLPAAFADDATRLARFEREAQALAALSHPNIAAIYGLEESGGARALVMELVEGQTLSERIAAGPIPLEEALAIARQIADALEAAHEKGIIHRDLKPANIKLTPEGKVKVLDFGLAKAFDPQTASGNNPNLANSTTLTLESTTAGVILGTAAYMSPEQARGKSVDKRADIWAFGVVFYEMLTGRSTFEGETVSDTLAGVLRADIDWRLLPATTPPAVRRLVEHCLQRDPKRRLRDIGDAWIEIDSPAAAAPTPALVAPAPSRRMPWIAAGVAALVALAGIAWGILRKPAAVAGPVVRWTYSQEKPILGVSLSRDGSRLAFMEISGNALSFAVRMMDQFDAKPIAGTETSYLPVFSPDGQWIAFAFGLSDFKLKKIAVTGGTPITLCDVPGEPFGLAWGDDGNIVFSTSKGLMRVSSSGGTPETVTTVDSKKGEAAHRWPNVLPGSRAVVFSIQSGQSSQVAVLDLKNRAIRILVPNGSSPRYIPTGHLVYYRVGTLFAAPFNASKLEITGPEAPVVEHVSSTIADGGDYTISDNGLLVYVGGSSIGGGGKTILNWADRKGVLQALSEPSEWGTGRLSPDASHVANSIRTGNTEDIWTYDLVRRTPTRLTFEGTNSFPIWSPDGRWIAFSGTIAQKPGLYRVAADASGKPELLLQTDVFAIANSWSPDGKTIVYSQAGADKKNHLWSVAIPGGKPVQLHESAFSEHEGAVSPDGRWLAYGAYDSGAEEVYVQPFPGPGAKTRISTQGGQRPRWSRDGKELFYWTYGADRQLMGVAVHSGPAFGVGLPQSLFKLPAGTTWDVAPDGKRFLVETPLASTAGGQRMEAVVNWFDELTRRVPVK
jgi:eukaryotic-like serine/threonine-protein kinase